jgi:hypothetical protein
LSTKSTAVPWPPGRKTASYFFLMVGETGVWLGVSAERGVVFFLRHPTTNANKEPPQHTHTHKRNNTAPTHPHLREVDLGQRGRREQALVRGVVLEEARRDRRQERRAEAGLVHGHLAAGDRGNVNVEPGLLEDLICVYGFGGWW